MEGNLPGFTLFSFFFLSNTFSIYSKEEPIHISPSYLILSASTQRKIILFYTNQISILRLKILQHFMSFLICLFSFIPSSFSYHNLFLFFSIFNILVSFHSNSNPWRKPSPVHGVVAPLKNWHGTGQYRPATSAASSAALLPVTIPLHHNTIIINIFSYASLGPKLG